MEPTETGNEINPANANLVIRSNRPMRMAGVACLIVLFMAVYVGFDINQAIGQTKSLYEVAIPATRILSDMQYETQESRHAMMHANFSTDRAVEGRYMAEFAARSHNVALLLEQMNKLRVPAEMRPKIEAFRKQWVKYLALSSTSDHRPPPGSRDRQFQETTKAARHIHDYLDEFSKNSAALVRMAFLRVGFELVLLLLGTLHMISILATNGEKRRAFESLRVLNQHLQSARVAADESSKLKSEFLATVSHEIRTPMNGIIGMAELLSRSPLNEEQKSYNETVRVSAEALLSILNDILDFSRMEAGKLVLENASFVPFEPAFQMADLLAPAAAQKGLEFVIRVAPNLPQTVMGDAGRVRQVLMNLAGNAIKFTHSGHVMVEVEAVETGAKHCRIRFTVRDTGIGIPDNKIDALFETFTQADASTTRRYGGTGLGLAIARKLVHLMGGVIEVKSEDGVGSTFSFELSVPVVEQVLAPAPAPFALRQPKVLVIEPSEVSARTLMEMLKALGASARCTGSAEEAAKLIEADASYWQAVLVSSRVQTSDPALFVRIQRLLGKSQRLIVLAPRSRMDPHLAARDVRVVAKPVQLAALEESLRLTIVQKTPLPKPEGEVLRGDLQRLATSVSPPASRGLRILVAEDNAVNQTIVRKLLERAGCVVDVANGRQAISQWEEGEYDLILMDCQMPEVDGFEATREIRKRELSGERVPIIAITANVLDKDRTHCFAAGMDDFLSKPLRLIQLQDAVARWTVDRRPEAVPVVRP